MRELGAFRRRVWSWKSSAVVGSSDRLNWSRQRKEKRARLSASSSRAPRDALGEIRAWAAIL